MGARTQRSLPKLLKPGLLAVLVLLVGGCSSVGYYAQAVKGHFQIVSRETACKKLLADTNTAPELRARLELVRQLCAFATENLGLPGQGAYERYADLERPYVVWNVYAAPRYSLEPKTWWYPFVGSLDYRGYFSERAARRYADKLTAKGFDVYVEGVEAYSTLGWFKDPLLNTFLHHDEPILAEVLFHELAHQRLFVHGDTDFNEAFATAVAQAGVRSWLKTRGEEALLARYDAALKRNDAFVRIVEKARHKLETLYRLEPGDRSDESLETGKQEVLEELRKDFAKLRLSSEDYAGYEPWFADRLNNAMLNSVATYYELVPAFDSLLAAKGGDLEPFYEAVKKLSKLPEAERHEQLAMMGRTLAEAK